MSLFRVVRWISEGDPVLRSATASSRATLLWGEIARGTVAGLAPVGYEVINLGSDKPIKLLDAVRQVETCSAAPPRAL